MIWGRVPDLIQYLLVLSVNAQKAAWKAISLPCAGGSEPLVAVGTCQSFGEDYPATGRVLFFQITRKAGGNGGEEEEWDTNLIYSRYDLTWQSLCQVLSINNCRNSHESAANQGSSHR